MPTIVHASTRQRAAVGPGVGKLAGPTLHRVFANQRLFDLMDGEPVRRIAWVHGPPGAGKTTLVASWLAARARGAVSWYRLDEGDRDPATLFAQLAGSASDRSLPLLTPEFRASPPLFARRFVRELFAGDPSDRAVLVLDDYHEIGSDAPLDQCLRAAAEEVPEGALVVVISRTPPPPALARLRLHGVLDVVGPESLRLGSEETLGLIRARGIALAPETVAAIGRSSQGWAAGVILMLESGHGCCRPGAPAPDALPPLLFEYFAGEIFERMPDEARTLLRILALMPTTTAAVAVWLTQSDEAGPLLEDLQLRNYFTTRDSSPEPVYRFHPLFRDFLLHNGIEFMARPELDALRRRAAVILEETGLADAAVPLLAAAGAHDALADLVRRRAGGLLAEGRHDTLMAWLGALPESVLRENAWLLYWAGAARVQRMPGEAYPLLQRAYALFDAADDAEGLYLSWLGQMESVRLDAFGDFARYDPLLDVLPSLNARHPVVPPSAALIPFTTAVAHVRRRSDREAIAAWQAHALADVTKPSVLALLRAIFAIGDLQDGRFVKARMDLDSLPDPISLTDHPLAQVSAYIVNILAILWRQRAGDCIAYIEAALPRIEAQGFYSWMPMIAGFASNEARRRGDIATQKHWLQRMAGYADRISVHRSAHYHMTAAHYAMAIGNLAEALAHADKTIDLSLGWYFYEVSGRIVRGEVLVEQGDFIEATAELDRAYAVLARSATAALGFSARLLRADLLMTTGPPRAAYDELAAAMALGKAQDQRRPLLARARNARLCARALDLDIEPAFVRALIRHTELPSPSPYDERWPWPIRIVTLGRFSIEIDGVTLAFGRKVPRRLLTLAKAIAAHGGRLVPEQTLIDIVWPDEEADAATNALGIAVHRLRKLLGSARAVVVSDGAVGFEPSLCWLDVATLDHLLGGEDAADTFDRLLALYGGDFLAGEDDLPWAKPPRERWRRRFAKKIADLAARAADPESARRRALYAAGVGDALRSAAHP